MGAGRGSTSNAISEAERFRAGSGYELGYKFATGRASCNARAVKIAFINSSAEPGRDGMGDYSLSLAAALRSLGHSVLVVGLTDRWVTTVFTDANSDGVELERIPSSLSLGERIDTACMRLKTFRPDWMSFQMSCYAHHRKGILCGFNRHLPRLVATCENWQVMVQELWVGFHVGAPWKHRLVGAVQKYGIQRALRILRPKLLQTSTPLFQAFLRTLGMEASVLPLAGSIPVDPDPGEGWFLEMLGEEGSPVAAEERSGHLVGGFFGAIYPGWESEGFFPSLRKVAEKTGRKVTIFAAGRMGAVGEAIWNRLAKEHPGIRFRKLGELPFVRVSHYLRNLDFGIAATTWFLIGKSSATAAMLDHGIPVLVPGTAYRPRQTLQLEPPADPLLIPAEQDFSARFIAGLPRRSPRHTSSDLAAEFVRQLEAARSAPRLGD